MEIGQDRETWGLIGLFVASFLAATVLPFSSEALLAAMVGGGGPVFPLLAVASMGNTLGGLTNYSLGRLADAGRLLRWMGTDPRKSERWLALAERYGAWAALICWMPFIGDPIAIALGLGRTRPIPTAVLMFIGKTLRYAALIALLR